jgi:hypothetical protein
MSEVIIEYPELELGGQSVQTKKGAKGAKKMYINYRVVECNDKREFEEYSEDEQCTQKNFLQYGNYLVTDARKKDGSLFMLSTLEQFMINFKGVVYRAFKKNPLWNNKAPWYTEILKTLTDRLRNR